MANKVKGHKMDARLVSMQKWELQYVASKFGISIAQVRIAMKQSVGGKKIGRSRKRLYQYLRGWL